MSRAFRKATERSTRATLSVTSRDRISTSFGIGFTKFVPLRGPAINASSVARGKSLPAAIWRETGTKNGPSVKYRLTVLVEFHGHRGVCGPTFILERLLAHNPAATS